MGSDVLDASIDAISGALPDNLQSPRVGIICGSGLGGIVNVIRDVVLVPYENIPGFSKSTGEAVSF
jgi:purine-nucleoside phosphorylase